VVSVGRSPLPLDPLPLDPLPLEEPFELDEPSSGVPVVLVGGVSSLEGLVSSEGRVVPVLSAAPSSLPECLLPDVPLLLESSLVRVSSRPLLSLPLRLPLPLVPLPLVPRVSSPVLRSESSPERRLVSSLPDEPWPEFPELPELPEPATPPAPPLPSEPREPALPVPAPDDDPPR
jgi:hypothetical protein